MNKKFSATASYNGKETIIRAGKEIVRGCIGNFRKDTDDMIISYTIFESNYENQFKKVADNWFNFLSYSDEKYNNPDWKDEDGIPYKNQEEFLHQVTFLITKDSISKINERKSLLAYGSDCKDCKYHDYYDVFNTIFWTSDDSIMNRWKYFHQ